MTTLVNQNLIHAPQAYLPGRTPGGSQENLYEALESYYHSNGLYDSLQAELYYLSTWTPAMKPLRNPAHRSVEFYASHLWPGNLPDALPIVEDGSTDISEAVSQVWEWSAWESAKQRAARWFAMLGNLFLINRISADRTKTFIEPLKPSEVTEFTRDYRGNLTTVRIDRETTVDGEHITHTEWYDKSTYKIWEGDHNASTPLGDLGTPALTGDLLKEFGIDCVPVVHAKFYDCGDKLGNGCFVHALDKIDEANRQATRLHEILYRYNKNTWAVMANSVAPSGAPLPAPRLVGPNGSAGSGPRQDVETHDDDIYYLPGASSMESLIPKLDYSAALSILQAMDAELVRDLPELLFYDLSERGDLSGKALRTLLSGAIARAVEARGQAESALVRSNQLALSIGQHLELPGFEAAAIGTYAAGDFKHHFAKRDVIEATADDRAATLKGFTDAGVPLEAAMRLSGFSESEIQDATKAKDKEARASKAALVDAMAAAERDFNAGGNMPDDAQNGQMTNAKNMTNVTSNADANPVQ